MTLKFIHSTAHAISVVALGLWAGFGATPAIADEPAGRIVSLGGIVTEIVHALGQAERLVARDSTSSYPPEVMSLPDVGYVRRLSPEGVLSVQPDMIIAAEGAGPVETIDVLKAAETPYVVVPEGYTPEAIQTKIQIIGEALNVPEAADALGHHVEAAFADVFAEELGEERRVMFVLSTQGGRIMAAGSDTGAHGVITLAGGTNVFAAFEGYKQVSDEAVVAAAPEVIVMMDRGNDHGSSDETLFGMPAIASTPAGKNRQVLRINGLLITGFGPRTPQAVKNLRDALAELG